MRATKVYQPTLVPLADTQPVPGYILKNKEVRDWSTIPADTKKKLHAFFFYSFQGNMERGPVNLRGLESAPWYWQNDANGIRHDLAGIDLEGVDLRETSFRRACLDGANFQGSDLRNADLKGVTFKGANLRQADLRGAKLDDTTFHVLLTHYMYKTELEEANLEGAIYSRSTIWPEFFDPVRAGAILVSD